MAAPSQPTRYPGLVLGVSPEVLVGSVVSELMPLPSGVTGLLEAGMMASARGGMKKRAGRAPKLGGSITVTARHQNDGCPVELQVTAVRRPGPYGSAFLLLRPSAPSGVQRGFVRWLYDNDTSGLMTTVTQRLGRTGTGVGASRHGVRRVASIDNAVLAAAGVIPSGSSFTSPARFTPTTTALSFGGGGGGDVSRVPGGSSIRKAASGAVAADGAPAGPPPPPPPPVTSIEGPPVASNAGRMAAMRGSSTGGAATNSGTTASRLWMRAVHGKGTFGFEDSGGEIPELPSTSCDGTPAGAAAATDVAGAGAVSQACKDAASGVGSGSGGLEQDVLVAKASIDTAFERGGVGRSVTEGGPNAPLAAAGERPSMDGALAQQLRVVQPPRQQGGFVGDGAMVGARATVCTFDHEQQVAFSWMPWLRSP
jgi:hypothetical protein